MPGDTVPTDGPRDDALRCRLLQAVLVISTVGFSWYAMMAVHEAGHALTAALSGGRVTRLVVPLLGFSRTDLAGNPHPLLVVWGGPVLGCILPPALWGLLGLLHIRYTFLARFFAGFCLLVNGIYIGAGSFWRIADAGVMIRHGSPRWLLVAFGAVAAAGGLALWNGLGPRFGLGAARGQVDARAAALMACTFIATAALVGALG
jgi:hypothetical protein